MTLSATYKSELRSRQGTPVIELVKITHSIAPQVMRFADNPDDVTSNSEVFQAYKLWCIAPKESKDINTDLTVVLSGVDPTGLLAWLQQQPRTEAALVSIYRVRALSPDTIEESYLDCPISSWTFDEETAEITLLCRWETILGQPISRVMGRTNYPGLYRDA